MKRKKKWFLLTSAVALVLILIFIIATLSSNEEEKAANSKLLEKFNSKEECYEAAEKYKAECIKGGKTLVECLTETYCDSRGCC